MQIKSLREVYSRFMDNLSWPKKSIAKTVSKSPALQKEQNSSHIQCTKRQRELGQQLQT